MTGFHPVSATMHWIARIALGASVLAVSTVAGALVPASVLAQVTVEERLAPGEQPVVIAHRAIGGGAPENSLAGIQYAIDRGVDMVEVDLQITNEGNYILMHDTSLTRTTNVEEVFPDGAPSRKLDDPDARKHLVSDYTLEDIARLNLRDEHGGNHPVPTLDAALDRAKESVLVILELKRWEIESLTTLLEGHETSNLLLFSYKEEDKLAFTAEATGISVYATLWDRSDIERGFQAAVERYGSRLKMVDVTLTRFSPDLLVTGRQHGVRVAIDGKDFQDKRLRAGSSIPWEKTLRTGAEGFWTQHPDAVMELLGR